MHSAEGFTHDNWWQANSIAGLMKVLEASQKGGGSSPPLLVSSTRHWDQIYISRFYNWKAGSWKNAYGYAGTYKLKPDAPDADDAVRTLSSFYVPVFEKMLADGTIVEYEIDREMMYTADSAAGTLLATILAGALAGSPLAQAPDAGCASPSEPEGIPTAIAAAITGPADKDRACMKALLIPEARMMFLSIAADGAPSYKLEGETHGHNTNCN